MPALADTNCNCCATVGTGVNLGRDVRSCKRFGLSGTGRRGGLNARVDGCDQRTGIGNVGGVYGHGDRPTSSGRETWSGDYEGCTACGSS